MGKRYTGVGKRYTGVGKRYTGVGKRYTGVGKRYTGVGRGWYFVVIIVALATVALASYHRQSIAEYDYRADQELADSSVSAGEDYESAVLSNSKNYKINPVVLQLGDNNEYIAKSGIDNPFQILKVTKQEKGVYCLFDFEESGYLKDFTFTLLSGKTRVVHLEDLVDCSNQVRIWVNGDFGDTLIISDFGWSTSENSKLATIDLQGGEVFGELSDCVTTSGNGFSFSKGSLKFSVEKVAYNSLRVKSSNWFGKKENIYLLIVNGNREIDSFKLSNGSRVLCFGSSIEKVKIIEAN